MNATSQPQDAGPRRRKSAVRATRYVEPLRDEVPYVAPKVHYVKTEHDLAMDRAYAEKRAREKAHAAKPADRPF